ncbi:GNAT family N-acetyltransferase [Gimesia aquarii]|uniref:N-acetyltransferase domain-containing protein n=1 Tax=Gimesia aquarii TaxID=2527964 RepID=A0A517VV33_9PLAN|nr:hypothetical protein V144x_23340 [Gimesia aquarii]
MREISIRNVSEEDLEIIVDLNASEIHYTSLMDLERLRFLNSISEYHKVAMVDKILAGFLLVMRNDCGYVNDNFDWFASRYKSFLYIDRIVIDRNYRGLMLGSILYEDLFHFAQEERIPYIACEYNIVPLNKPSRSLHDKFSFRQVGTQWLYNHTKKVSLQIAKTFHNNTQ